MEIKDIGLNICQIANTSFCNEIWDYLNTDRTLVEFGIIHYFELISEIFFFWEGHGFSRREKSIHRCCVVIHSELITVYLIHQRVQSESLFRNSDCKLCKYVYRSKTWKEKTFITKTPPPCLKPLRVALAIFFSFPCYLRRHTLWQLAVFRSCWTSKTKKK